MMNDSKGRLENMVKRPTITDLARRAGVSVATVDRVLNRRLPVRDDTAQRVVVAAEAIGYHATGLIKRRMSEVPRRSFGFLLQKRADAFYQTLGAELAQAAKSAIQVQAKTVVEFVDELVPPVIARRIRELGQKVDGLAIVAVDHPLVNDAVEELAAAGKVIITLLSDIASPARTAYLAVDSRKAGRTAAWAISRLAKQPGKIGILVGSHRYLSQEIAEMSFRSYIREHAPEFQLLEPVINLDDGRIAYEAVSDMLARNRDLAGLYMTGGGQEGMIEALRDERAGSRIIGVCNELTTATKSALIDGTVDLVLDTPVKTMAARAVELMARAMLAPNRERFGPVLFPADIYISENI